MLECFSSRNAFSRVDSKHAVYEVLRLVSHGVPFRWRILNIMTTLRLQHKILLQLKDLLACYTCHLQIPMLWKRPKHTFYLFIHHQHEFSMQRCSINELPGLARIWETALLNTILIFTLAEASISEFWLINTSFITTRIKMSYRSSCRQNGNNQ